jgi:signal transduction histidine kinase
VVTLFLIGLSVYYIISSWKTLRGAQWSVVAGLLAVIFSVLLVTVLALLFPGHIYSNIGIGYFLNNCIVLAFPFSLLVFIAMRFNEMLRDVKQNADEVVRLSDEKKQEALNRQKLLEEEVNRQTAEIRANQARLIQSEKMASLGELTAGIAHEIQNPLNFVNNFSEVNKEMLEELKAESEKPKAERDEQLEIELINNLIDNEDKISHHGKRADSIVKGMLEHSRNASGQKEPTDINQLADEYLRLSYHGLRAKDKSFNAELVTHFDAALPKVNATAQDIGRVLLNLFNNAFYAVNQKQKTAVADYKPEVLVSTSTANGQVVIKVKDNGVGIPDAVKEKIMQPFFTTKPTGEGTGLGLSLTYDMVVKGHGSSITVESQEGQFTNFTLILPL